MNPKGANPANPGYEFRSGKTYTHAHGLSCAFRQWRATSHCNKLHGYSLQVELEFSAQNLDERNWVVDFGGLKQIKALLEEMFDHKTLVAYDDPQISIFRELQVAKVIDLVVVEHVGCEAFARMIHHQVEPFVAECFSHARLEKVTVREHGGNHASYGRV